MNQPMIMTFVILAVTTLFFINGKFRTDAVAVGSMLTLVLFGIITPTEALSGFSNSIVIMIAGLFVVGAGIFRTGLAKLIGKQLLKLAGKNETKLLIVVMLVVGIFSGFMSNTGTVAVLLPVVLSLALEMKVSPSKFLIPLAYASSLGGVLTLIGTPPNLVVSQTLKDYNYEGLAFFDFTIIGLVALITGLLFMVTVGKRLLPDYKVTGSGKDHISPEQLAGYYKLQDELFCVRVLPESSIVGKTLAQLKVRERYHLTVVEIDRREGERFSLIQQMRRRSAASKSEFHVDDILFLLGKKGQVHQFADENGLAFEAVKPTDRTNRLVSKELGLTEIIISAHSDFINRTVAELNFREIYQLNVLAINRRGKYIRGDLIHEKLRFGDALLVHGEWRQIELLGNDSSNVILTNSIEDDASNAFAKGKAPIALAIMVFMLILMTFNIVSSVIAVMISAFLMLVTGCLRNMDEAYRNINWESVVLIAAMLPMATALEKTGGVELISNSLVTSLGGFGPTAVMAGFYIVTMILSQFISNTATAVIFAPIAITASVSMGVSPYPLLLSVSVAASMAFATPVASPTNALVLTAGGYQFKDFVKVGVPLQVVIMIVMMFTIPLVYPF
ncbi:SLC13 family permease [Bacillus solimangrovi]|uniref:Tricarboxylate transporter n=1 Tax=Bacillus solimangrovi TaxID=1305675 RepID=A0A1E5LJF2_9BACI|nr:SLC13 family permease [Bacillus solimangrovi]OEH94223.1 tricarboxylate transporter [Bacillus solimangrovi]